MKVNGHVCGYEAVLFDTRFYTFNTKTARPPSTLFVYLQALAEVPRSKKYRFVY
jgi:hypothetical protein